MKKMGGSVLVDSGQLTLNFDAVDIVSFGPRGEANQENAPRVEVLGIDDLLSGVHVSNGAIQAEINTPISGGFLRVEAVDATTARIVLDTDGTGSGGTSVPIVTLENLGCGFDANTLLTTLLNNDPLN